MTDFGGAAAAAEILGNSGRRDPAGQHLSDAEAHGVCANCDAQLTGPYCAECGQKAHLHHRLRDLIVEGVESIAHFDGRLWRTLPLLASNPGRLSREWRAGRRVRYIQPLHLFLFAIFLFFTLPQLTGRHLINLPSADSIERNDTEAARIIEETEAQLRADGVTIDIDEITAGERKFDSFVRDKLDNSEYYSYKIETLSYKLSFLLAPLSMAILALLMLFRRGFNFYDHGVVSLYGMGFAVLTATTYNVLSWILAAMGLHFMGWVPVLLLVGLQVHAVFHLKGAYSLSWPGAIIRGWLLGVMTLTGFGLFLAGVVALGLFG